MYQGRGPVEAKYWSPTRAMENGRLTDDEDYRFGNAVAVTTSRSIKIELKNPTQMHAATNFESCTRVGDNSHSFDIQYRRNYAAD